RPVPRRDRRADRHAARHRQGACSTRPAVDPGRPPGRTRGGPRTLSDEPRATPPRATPPAHDLLADRALHGLDDADAHELRALGADADPRYHLDAAAVDLAPLPIHQIR